MAKKSQRQTEEELRKKIREELHQKYEQKKETRQTAQAKAEQPQPEVPEETIDDYFWHQALEAQVYGAYPEFVRCENHINEVKWLTLWELEGEYEFYPTEESRLTRWKNKWLGKQAKIVKAAEEKNPREVAALREKLQADARARIAVFREKQEQARKAKKSELEKKIFQEEIDRFYSKKKGYKKYTNHLNEFRWMTDEEFRNQEEFQEEVELPGQKWRRRIVWAVLSLLVLASLVWMWNTYKSEEIHRAWVVVTANDSHARLYVDKVLAVGYSAGQPYVVSPGTHTLALVRKGYSAVPRTQTLDVAENDTVSLNFTLEENKFAESGLVKLSAPYKDAEIIVNGEFLGSLETMSELNLASGSYTLTLEKPGYSVSPPQQAFHLNAGDTLSFTFHLRPHKQRRSRSSERTAVSGFIEVRSSVKDADIYLDGQKTSFQTDYVLQGIPLGSHIVRVVKAGYNRYPDEQVVKLTEKNNRAQVSFTLSSVVKRVILKTKPFAADIFVDGKSVGKGEVRLSLPQGKHAIDFAEVPYYDKPKQRYFVVGETSDNHFNFDYNLNYHVLFTPAKTNAAQNKASVQQGYLLNDESFRRSNENGPEIRSNAKINGKVWMLGYAFRYRNPPGKDALQLIFDIPETLDLSQPIYLKLWAYRTKDLYPLVLRGDTRYSVFVNQFGLKKNIRPVFWDKEISQDHFQRFQINELLHPGYNRILITTTAQTTAHMMLWKAAIE